MKEGRTDETVVLGDLDNWVEYGEEMDGEPTLRVSQRFAGKRLMMTERYRHKMIDAMRMNGPTADSRAHAEEAVRLTLDALGVEVIADA